MPEQFNIDGPCCDMQSRNLILQLLGSEITYSDDDQAATDQGARESKAILPETNNPETLDQTKPFARYTAEYYAAIKDMKQRQAAYRELVICPSVLSAEEAEIIENPFKFLNLPEDATFGQVRAAWITLNRLLHPDRVHPENKEQYRAIFGCEINPKLFGESVRTSHINKVPLDISTEAFNKLTPDEQKEYLQKHEDYEGPKARYEEIKSDMQLRATEMVKVINKAYKEAKKRFSKSEQKSFAGFSWRKSEFRSRFSSSDEPELRFDHLPLESLDGEIRKNTYPTYFDDRVYLAYGREEVECRHYDYGHELGLRAFFAWTELIQNQELSPTLLDDIVKTNKLNNSQSEQLRLMVLNRESCNFIIKALSISDLKNRNELRDFLDTVYYGPSFFHQIRAGDDSRSFLLGVEFSPAGGLILKLRTQDDILSFESTYCENLFPPVDLQVMQSIAYGPLLQDLKEEENN